MAKNTGTVEMSPKNINSTDLHQHVGKMKLVGILIKHVNESSDEACSTYWTSPCFVA